MKQEDRDRVAMLARLPNCKACGDGRPVILQVGYGKAHNDIQCQRCGYTIECDHTERHCASEWRKEMTP